MSDTLHLDPRSSWAFGIYLEQRAPRGVSDDLGRKILSKLGKGDIIELIADAVITGPRFHNPRTVTADSHSPAIAVRTLRSWILARQDTGTVVVVQGAVRQQDGPLVFSERSPSWGTELGTPRRGTMAFMIFFDRSDCIQSDVIQKGAGPFILRLPESPEVPAMLHLGARPAARPVEAALPVNWRVAEEIACDHMRMLGFADANLTSNGRDMGVDVVARDAAAQVKMQALPVGAPTVQQLRGAMPEKANHLFYSTSGYAAPAVEFAARSGVSLFKIDKRGIVQPENENATRLVRDGARPNGVGVQPTAPMVKAYAEAVRSRIQTAWNSTDWREASAREAYKGQFARISPYYSTALASLQSQRGFNNTRAAAIHYHHAELLAHILFQEFGVPYPAQGGQPQQGRRTQPAKRLRLDDYYVDLR